MGVGPGRGRCVSLDAGDSPSSSTPGHPFLQPGCNRVTARNKRLTGPCRASTLREARPVGAVAPVGTISFWMATPGRGTRAAPRARGWIRGGIPTSSRKPWGVVSSGYPTTTGSSNLWNLSFTRLRDRQTFRRYAPNVWSRRAAVMTIRHEPQAPGGRLVQPASPEYGAADRYSPSASGGRTVNRVSWSPAGAASRTLRWRHGVTTGPSPR